VSEALPWQGNALLEQKPNQGLSAPLARLSSRRLTRLTNGFSKKLDCHVAAVSLHVAHYNLCRVHESLRSTPAMALGIDALRPSKIVAGNGYQSVNL
jgi:hypothetical protein